MEQAKVNKSNWIVLICAGVVAVALMIIEGALGHYTAIYAIGAVCFSWASIFYFLPIFCRQTQTLWHFSWRRIRYTWRVHNDNVVYIV